MIKNVCGLKLMGANFLQSTELSLFDSSKGVDRISLLYGKNGAGKSTISKAFAKIKGVDETEISYAELYDRDANILSIPSEEIDRIEIFNEKYVDDNIRFSPDGLDTIVVIGKQKDIDDKIAIENKKFIEIKERYNSQKKNVINIIIV
ncbi:MAG TPA: hypothetical protein DHW61_05515 [Lachnoclostridium phytofermentans]|uniref:Protein CR006 P-loop domain-containing protein n=1 Tax=Lachnoclostridium phytofermentans TaxID=66219 RepID=A0A3D2X4N1_9FIRM|nr:AAA family ATPase [Lachnoclostridium sp.]HCL01864.1 hypothetical protein [Lachnoclostridium phytofermentans]